MSSLPVPIFLLVIVTWVFCGLLFIAAIVGTILYFANRPGTGPRRVGGAIGMVCGLFLGVLLVLGTVVMGYRTTVQYAEPPKVSTAQFPQLQPVQAPPQVNTDAGLKRLPDVEPNGSSVDALAPSTGHDDRSRMPESRPGWTNVAETKQGDVSLLVFESKQYSTIDEARQELAAAVKIRLDRDFKAVFHTPAGGIRDLPLPDLKRLAVRNEYVETIERDFGTFFAPMHRVWWQLELSPAVRTDLRSQWKAQVQETRTLTVGGALLGITVALAGLSLFTRRRSVVMGQRTV